MFLKVMHDGADEFLATAQSEATYSLFADVTSCDFKRQPDGSAVAHIQCREPIKTAEVPGYAEIQKFIDITGDAFLMNDQGRTISKFILRPFGAKVDERTGGTDEMLTTALNVGLGISGKEKFYKALPYWVAVGFKMLARQQNCDFTIGLLQDFEHMRIAVDA